MMLSKFQHQNVIFFLIFFQINTIEVFFMSETNPEDPKNNLSYKGYPYTETRDMELKIDLNLQRSK